MCTEAEVTEAIGVGSRRVSARGPSMPVQKRTEVLFTWRPMLLERMDEIATLVSTELGKNLDEARGEVVKIIEAIDVAVGAPMLMKGESLMNVATGHDTVSYREPLGVFAGIAPFNFPAMIPFGWMLPLCIATGNTFVLKAANPVPLTSHMLLDLLYSAGLPKGVVNMVTAEKEQAEVLLKHPAVRGVSFVGTTPVGKHIYSIAAAHGKRVQAQTQAKNHGLVLQRRLARARRPRHHQLHLRLRRHALHGPAGVRRRERGRRRVRRLHEEVRRGARRGRRLRPQDGARPGGLRSPRAVRQRAGSTRASKRAPTLVLDGRDIVVPGFEGGHFVGPTIFDNVTPEMTCGWEEAFGPVLFIKRVEGLRRGPHAHEPQPLTPTARASSPRAATTRVSSRARTHAGMVGINVGIPVPVSFFPFSGHKDSFFGDNHVLGKDGVQFFTETKCVTTRWFTEADKKQKQISHLGRHRQAAEAATPAAPGASGEEERARPPSSPFCGGAVPRGQLVEMPRHSRQGRRSGSPLP